MGFQSYHRESGLYWGKIIGTLVGLATMRPWFAVLGLILGHQFDLGYANRFRYAEARFRHPGRLPEYFLAALFKVLGRLAKTDGRVTEPEIRVARSIMHRVGLTPAQVRRAIDAFELGKQPDFAFAQSLGEFQKKTLHRPDLRALFVQLLVELALADGGIDSDERALLWSVCTSLGIGRVEFAQLEAMIRAQKGFRRTAAGDADIERLHKAYQMLGVNDSASNDEIKKAYRRQMNRHHPDKIAANKPGPLELAGAQKRTREIRLAYEMLKARRSIR